MFVLDGGILGGHGPAEEAAFLQGYGPVEPDPLALLYYRYDWALDDLASFAEEAGRGDPEAARWFERQFAPRGIVASAFRADDALFGKVV